jgi:hypothetical protein
MGGGASALFGRKAENFLNAYQKTIDKIEDFYGWLVVDAGRLSAMQTYNLHLYRMYVTRYVRAGIV